jgi:hypothetical protein
MVQLSPELRKRVADFLSLDHDPSKEFPAEFSWDSEGAEDSRLTVYAEHGHRYDPINWHQRTTGRWAIGDAIVLRLVNRFGELARDELHLTDKMRLGRAVHEIDNVEPHYEIPLYIAWLAQTHLTSKTQRSKLLACWKTAVRDFLDLPEFREDRYGKFADAIRWLRTLYTLGVDVDPLLKHLNRVPRPRGIGVDYRRESYLAKSDADLRVLGHTHEPGLWPLPEANGRRRYYVNTGTWRRVIRRVQLEKGQLDFAGHRVSAYLVVRQAGEFFLSTRCKRP